MALIFTCSIPNFPELKQQLCVDLKHRLLRPPQVAELQRFLDEARAELTRAKQREKLNEEHNLRLTGTVDKLLLESNERLQCHLREKMVTLEEKNQLNNELDRIRR